MDRYFVYEEYVDQAALEHHEARTDKSEWAVVTKNMQRHFDVLSG